MFEFIENRSNFSITFSKLSQYYQMYSGNLDARQIRNILLKYGINYTAECSELQSIKNNRNKLAHGEMSFEEVGRDLTIQYIEKLKDETFKFLTNMIPFIQEYLDDKRYLD